jgi:hypothetical protein
VRRLRGDILRLANKPPSEAAACYEAAAAVARRQGAKMWERKAMQSLSALHEGGAVSLAGNWHKPAVMI